MRLVFVLCWRAVAESFFATLKKELIHRRSWHRSPSCATDVGMEDSGLAYHAVKPGRQQPFGHRHKSAEEIHVILSGSGRVELDDELVEAKPLGVIRVAPEVTRAFEAGPDGLEYLVFSPRRENDFDMVPDVWEG